jgi:predicted transcriptional regulator
MAQRSNGSLVRCLSQTTIVLLGIAFALALAVPVAAQDTAGDVTIPDANAPPPEEPVTPPNGQPDEELEEALEDVKAPIGDPTAPAPDDGTGGIGDIGDDVAVAVSDNWMLTGAIVVSVAGVGLLVFFLASRYVDPKEALKNSHRSMLYGFVKGNPGVHLKQLSSEFGMKTSTVLWHVRKLECADLVRSKKANGFRVFYPVSGGLEARQLSTAITALSNDNARSIFEYVALNPSSHQRTMSEKLDINAGTVRWHVKKLRSAGLVAELTKERTAYYYATELGIKAMRQVVGLPDGVKAPAIEVLAPGDEAIPSPN